MTLLVLPPPPHLLLLLRIIVVVVFVLQIHQCSSVAASHIPTTLDGPFLPVTVPFDPHLRGIAEDLPSTDPRVRRRVSGFQPEQISVSLSTSFHSVWISWITGEYQIGYDIKPLDPSSVSRVVRFGRLKNNLNNEASKGYSLVYNQLYPFKGLQNYTSGIIHHVLLTGLEAEKVYYYQCGDFSRAAVSHVYSFKTMPEPGPQSYPKRIAIVGDLGLTHNTTTTVAHMAKNKPDLILLVGDVTYANLYLTNGTGSDCYSCAFHDTPIHETHQPRWDYWGRFMQNIISRVPIMVIEGNHEIEEQVGKQTFVAYSSRFAFPSMDSGTSSSKLYYSFDAGGIHFIMLGAYVDYHKSGEQYKWLVKDLGQVDRGVTPWVVAAWHPPWYSSYSAHYREAECMRVEMEEVLYVNRVDIIFNGHVHAYERSNRVFNYTLDPCGPLHIIVGDGGNREKIAVTHADEPGHCPDPSHTRDHMGGLCALNFSSGPASGRFCWNHQPDFSAFRESSFGHGILEVKNETWALWTWYRNQEEKGGEELIGDQIYIVRQPHLCPLPPTSFSFILPSPITINKYYN